MITSPNAIGPPFGTCRLDFGGHFSLGQRRQLYPGQALCRGEELFRAASLYLLPQQTFQHFRLQQANLPALLGQTFGQA
jgi:hypothetical protein